MILSEIQRQQIARRKLAAASKKEKLKTSNTERRKKALERKLELEGVGALTGEQLDTLRRVPAAKAKVATAAKEMTRNHEALTVDPGGTGSVGVKTPVTEHRFARLVWGSAWRR